MSWSKKPPARSGGIIQLLGAPVSYLRFLTLRSPWEKMYPTTRTKIAAAHIGSETEVLMARAGIAIAMLILYSFI